MIHLYADWADTPSRLEFGMCPDSFVKKEPHQIFPERLERNLGWIFCVKVFRSGSV